MNKSIAARVAADLNKYGGGSAAGMSVVVTEDGEVGGYLYGSNDRPHLTPDQRLMALPWANQQVTADMVLSAFAPDEDADEADDDGY
ncbi:hypothetical protein AB0I28_32250 [Phytomonospora sp. NPDC050363]|uniref:hypothetical protein n=1 Tax=Phytomonospora sp. NPDC050363 TaxID=3155642 RepID=UPI0033F9A0E8